MSPAKTSAKSRAYSAASTPVAGAARLRRRRIGVGGFGLGGAFAAPDCGGQRGAVDAAAVFGSGLGPGAARAAAARRRCSLFGRFGFGRALAIATGVVIAACRIAIVATVAPVVAAVIGAVIVAVAIAAVAAIVVALAVAALALIAVAVIAVAIEIGVIVRVEILDAADFTLAIVAIRRAAVPFFLAGAEIAVHAEIMVGKLKIIFGLDTVARKLGVAREIFVFLDHLRRVAARPAVDTIGLVDTAAAATRLRTVVVIVAAATATALPVVHVQLRHPDKLISYANPFWPTAPFARRARACRAVFALTACAGPRPRTSIASGKQTGRTNEGSRSGL